MLLVYHNILDISTSISSEQQILQIRSFTILDGSTIVHNSSQVGQTLDESHGDNNQEARPGAYGRFGARGYGLLLSYIKSIYASVCKPIFRLHPRSSDSSHPDPRVNRVCSSLDRSLDPHHPSSRINQSINQSRQSTNLLVFLPPLVATALYVSHGYRTVTKLDVLMLHGCLDCIVGPTGGMGYGTVRYT